MRYKVALTTDDTAAATQATEKTNQISGDLLCSQGVIRIYLAVTGKYFLFFKSERR